MALVYDIPALVKHEGREPRAVNRLTIQTDYYLGIKCLLSTGTSNSCPQYLKYTRWNDGRNE